MTVRVTGRSFSAHPARLAGAFLAIAALSVIVWYLASPLFVRTYVNEALPSPSLAPGTAEAFQQYLKLEPNGAHATEAQAVLQTLESTVQMEVKVDLARAARGMLTMKRGRFREAVVELRAAIEGGVKDVEVANALAFALVQNDETAEAASVLTRAAAEHPDNVNLMHNLARLLATASDPRVRDGERAVRLALEVCERTGNRDPRALDTLSAAYAASGRFAMAQEAASHAAARARELGDVETAAAIDRRARSYAPPRGR